tara:strand:- start:1083 stop:2462 length:1380 start_codon:yes stop_codon:yes gene_type:complete
MCKNREKIKYSDLSESTIARKKLIPDELVKLKMEEFFYSVNSSADQNFGDQDGGNALIHNLPEFKWLTKEIEIMVSDYLLDLGYNQEDFSIFFQKSWTVITNSGGMVHEHSHPNSTLSAVYYLKSENDKGGCLMFKNKDELFLGSIDKKAVLPKVEKSLFGLKPLENLLILFPSSLEHFVSIYKGDTPRWSITFDITFTTSSKLGSGRSENMMIHPKFWREFSYINQIKENSFEKTLENEESFESFKEKGYLVFENLINDSLCDLFFSEVLKKISINLNKVASEKDEFRINIPIDQSEISNEIIKTIAKKIKHIVKKKLDEKSTFLTEKGVIFSFPGALKEELKIKYPEKELKYISVYLNLIDLKYENGPLIIYPKSHIISKKTKDKILKNNPKKIFLKKGTVTIIDSRILKSEGANTSKSGFKSVFYFSFGDGEINDEKDSTLYKMKNKYYFCNFLKN